MNQTRLIRVIHFAVLALLLIGAAAQFTPRAQAQQVRALVALVNGEPITALDVQHRLKLLATSGRPKATRQEALDELINQKLKLQIAQRNNVNPTRAEVDKAFAGIAQRLGRSLADFEKVLQSNGIDVESFRARVKADVAWQQYLTANPSHFAIRDADLVAAMTARGQNLQGKAVQYTMQQVIFVTRRNAPPAVRQERIKQAEALRARVSSCEQAVQLSREYQETVVKPRVRRFSTDLSANLQKLLETLPDGKMTPPEPTANGIEVVAICDRKVIASDISANRELKNELMGQRLQAYEKKVLDQARAKSIIQIISQ
ncbi:MAG: SurA N-terminal domain-containing protein [Xanthobacteraceae bacterium]|nr:SurA N-terminal domain-containing protein [Xanthobacteraceae bacterium]QYK45998.1 MAG: SurA N-terminal domain-containing protein [Xanthobacteraceae bacterium]